MSEGEFKQVRPHVPVKRGPQDVDESSDMYDTIAWLLEHVPNHNGRVGLVGVSQPGFHVAASIIDAHPALKAASPQAPTADYYLGDDVYHNGAFMLGANFGFYSSFRPRIGGPQLPSPEPRFDMARPTHTSSSCRCRRWLTSTRSSSAAAWVTGKKSSTTRTTTSSGRSAPSGNTRRTSRRRS